MAPNVNLLGVGTYFPEKVVDNDDFDYAKYGISKNWVKSAGIKHRRWASNNSDNVDLAYRACLRALEQAEVSRDTIGLLIMVSSTLVSERLIPTGVGQLKDKLQLANCLCYFMLETCNGALMAMELAVSAIAAGRTKNALVVSSEIFSRTGNFDSIHSAKISMSMGDGAGAVVLGMAQRGEESSHWAFLESSAQFQSGLAMHIDSSAKPGDDKNAVHFGFTGLPPSLDGKFLDPESAIGEIKHFTIERIPQSINTLFATSGLTCDDVDFFLLHQPNREFLEAWKKEARIPPHKTLDTLELFGNLSSVSVLANLDMASQQGKIEAGDTIVLASVGEGGWGSSVWKWMPRRQSGDYLTKEIPSPVRDRLITIENYSMTEIWEKHILANFKSTVRTKELFTDFVPTFAVFDGVPINAAFDYIANIANMVEWTMSMRNLRPVEGDIYQGDETATPTGKVFIRCNADENSYLIDWQAGHETPDDLWIHYRGMLFDTSLTFGRHGSAFLWTNFVHQRVKDDPILSKGFELMYSAHKIEIGNLKNILEARYQQNV